VGTVEARVADDGGINGSKRGAPRWPNHDLAGRHALGHMVVRVAFQIHMQAARVPHTETLPGGAGEPYGNRRVHHAVIAVTTRDLAGYARADGAIDVLDFIIKFAATLAGDSAQHVREHALCQFTAIERFVMRLKAEALLVRGHIPIGQQRCQIQASMLVRGAPDNSGA